MGSNDWGANNTNKKLMSRLKKPNKANKLFRSSAKSRGSNMVLTKHPAAFPHQRYDDDPLVIYFYSQIFTKVRKF